MAEEPKPIEVKRDYRFKKDGTPRKFHFTKGHAPMGQAIKGYKDLLALESDRSKDAMEKYTKQQILKNKKALVDALIDKAKNKDVPALKECFDRIMGKSVSPMELSGKDGTPITVLSFRDFGHEKKEEKK